MQNAFGNDMNRPSPEQIPRPALWLGYAGLLPFIGLTLGMWFAPERFDGFLMKVLLSYSAIILTFTGAIHWALAMHANGELARRHMVFSVIPALIGWGLCIEFLPPGVALLGFIVGFVVVYLVDMRAVACNLAPVWYPTLRWPLTLIVCLTLLAAILAHAG